MYLNHYNLQKIRQKANLSQESMGMLMDIETSTYNRLENGKIKLKMEHVGKIAKAVGRTEEDIMSELSGCVFNNSINDTAQHSQNVVINMSDVEYFKKMIAEKDEIIKAKEQTINSQSLSIELLQSQISKIK